MPDGFEFADHLGPAKIVQIYDPAVGLRAAVAIDNVAAGPAIGGLRMAPDVSVAEAFRLARAMTLKNAAAGLPHGGGKAVIFGNPKSGPEEKERLIRAFARSIRDLTEYIVGPDMGTDERCMAWIHDEIGRSVGLPTEIGGIPLDEIGATGYGLAVSIDVVKDVLGLKLEDARVAVQGFGSVGQHAARFLAARGAKLIAAADSKGTLIEMEGIDIDALIEGKRLGQSVIDHPTGAKAAQDAIIDIECDIWIPAARPDVIDASNVGRLNTRLVAEGANIPVTPEAERMLDESGVLVLPDFIANAGGVICASVEYHGGTKAQAFQVIQEKISANTEVVLKMASEHGTTPRAAAEDLADERVRRAMEYRRRW